MTRAKLCETNHCLKDIAFKKKMQFDHRNKREHCKEESVA